MEFNVITTLDELDTIAVEWNALLENSASHVPFLRYEYLHAWWKTRGGGEWPFDQSRLKVITAKQDGHLLGIAPLFSAPNLQNEPSLLFIGSIEVSDFLDFIVNPHNLPAFIPALLDFLEEQDDPKWQTLDLYNILDDSPTLAILKASAETKGWSYTQEKLQPSPYITCLVIGKTILLASIKNSITRSVASCAERLKHPYRLTGIRLKRDKSSQQKLNLLLI